MAACAAHDEVVVTAGHRKRLPGSSCFQEPRDGPQVGTDACHEPHCLASIQINKSYSTQLHDPVIHIIGSSWRY